ncbi:MAG TPA: 6-phosphogluconolactonase [Bryobacteraceae bacterium]
MPLELEVFDDADSVARAAASTIASEARLAIAARGRYSIAVSGGHTPWIMLRELAREDIPWPHFYLYQVDERVAPDGHPDRNLTHLRESLNGAVDHLQHLYTMPVEAKDLAAAAADYALTLPAEFDLIHLGLGPDGHTASLVPGDPVLQVSDADVAITGVYQGRRRMTLTYPVLNRARRILWLITGGEKKEMLKRFLDRDQAIPAGRVRRDEALVLADRQAQGE